LNFDRSIDNAVSFLIVAALCNNFGPWVEDFLLDNVIEFGLHTLSKVLEPKEFLEEICFLFILTGIC